MSPSQLSNTCAQLPREKFRRRLTDDVLEFSDQVSLIGQITGASNLRPRQTIAPRGHHLLEARKSRKALRSHAKCRMKCARQVPAADAQPRCKLLQRQCWIAPEVRGSATGQTIPLWAKAVKQKRL